jgi:AbrB family looped-hinge helix DNA binding protein
MRFNPNPKLLGMTTVNEKGQVVIPKAVRTQLKIKSGDTVVMVQAPLLNAVVICKPEEFEKYLGIFSKDIKKSMANMHKIMENGGGDE